MSTQPNNVQSLASVKRFMEATIKGKVVATRRYEKKHYTRLITPAPDSYSRPQVVEISSNHSLGRQDDEITVDCKLGGFTRKPFRVIDKESGETSMVTPVDMTLTAID